MEAATGSIHHEDTRVARAWLIRHPLRPRILRALLAGLPAPLGAREALPLPLPPPEKHLNDDIVKLVASFADAATLARVASVSTVRTARGTRGCS